MSELKAISGNEIREDIDYNTRGIDPEDKEWCNYGEELCYTLYYLKSEADKVIAELEESHKKEVEQLLILNREQAISGNKLRDSIEQALRHQKFKRCLAMAMWCRLKRLDAADYRIPREKWEFYDKWNKRWLKIAEQFKDKEAK